MDTSSGPAFVQRKQILHWSFTRMLLPQIPGRRNIATVNPVSSTMHLTAYIGATVSLIAGLLGLLWPQKVSAVIGLRLSGMLGVSEFRATYGGLFIGAGGAVLILGSGEAALVLGAAWLGAFVARTISLIFDRSTSRENLAGCGIELFIGALLVLGR